ncbi:MAG: trypsin-like peptidase domain-containing protein [Verrucomicrobiota bacterium]
MLALLIGSSFLLAETQAPKQGVSLAPQSIQDLLNIQKHLKQILPKAEKATVAVLGVGAGSGVIVSPDGYVLTAGHVSGKPGRTVGIILADGRKMSGVTLGKVDHADAGMIKISGEGRFPHVPMAAPESVRVGDWSFALGHPGGPDRDRGAVVRLGRVIWQSDETMRTDCKLLGGDSGGPLFDLNGRVTGIHSRISKRPDENYHVPVATFRKFWEPMIAGKDVNRARRFSGVLGLKIVEHDQGLYIKAVDPGSAGAKAGLKTGDVLTRANGRTLLHHDQLRQACRNCPKNTRLQLLFLRNRKTLYTTASAEKGHLYE